jgi:hypothetical protein
LNGGHAVIDGRGSAPETTDRCRQWQPADGAAADVGAGVPSTPFVGPAPYHPAVTRAQAAAREGGGRMRRTTGTVLGAVAVVAAVAGCSGPSATGATRPGTAKPDTQSAAKAGTGGAPEPVRAVQAAFATASKDTSVTIHGTVGGPDTATETFAGVERFLPVELSMTVTSSGAGARLGDMSVIYDGSDVYLKSRAYAAQDGGRPWAEFSASSPGGGGAAASVLGTIKNESPTAQVQPLLASSDVKDLGAQEIDGVQTTHYSGTLDAAQVQKTASIEGLTAAQLEQIKQELRQTGESTETIDVWIDAAGLPVRTRDTATTASGPDTTVMDFSGWGAPVSITDPPADQVATMPGSYS